MPRPTSTYQVVFQWSRSGHTYEDSLKLVSPVNNQEKLTRFALAKINDRVSGAVINIISIRKIP